MPKRLNLLTCAKTVCVRLAPALLGLVAIPARAQFLPGGVFVCANCADEGTAMSIKITHDLEYAKQILQYAIQVQQLADAIRQSTHSGSAALTNASADLAQLATVVQGGQALAYSLGAQDVAFRRIFPGYRPAPAVYGASPAYGSTPGYGSSPAPGTYQSKYAQWAATSLATTEGILRGVGAHGRLLQTEQSVLGVLKTLSSSNLLNRNDALNLSGQLAAEQVGQLQKLRELQLEDMTSKAAYQGYQIQQQAAHEQSTQWFFNGGTVSSDHTGFWPGDK